MSEVDRMSNIERCPTCRETGPDVIDRVGDYGGDTFEARCGDDWHESEACLRQQLQGAVDALRSIAGKSRASGDYCQRVARLALAKLGDEHYTPRGQ